MTEITPIDVIDRFVSKCSMSNEQAEELDGAFYSLRGTLATITALQAERDALKAKVAELETPDLFLDINEHERCEADIWEFMSIYGEAEIINTSQARTLDNAYISYLVDPDIIITASSREEAKALLDAELKRREAGE